MLFNSIEFLLFFSTAVTFLTSLLIERSGNLLSQPRACKLQNVRDGLMMTVWGFFQKIVIADRAAIFVNQVFTSRFN